MFYQKSAGKSQEYRQSKPFHQRVFTAAGNQELSGKKLHWREAIKVDSILGEIAISIEILSE